MPSQHRLARAALQLIARATGKAALASSTTSSCTHQPATAGPGRGGESLDRLLPEAFGLVCVAAAGTVKLRPFDVQLAAGVVMHHGGLAELATGEGKTLVAAPARLPQRPGRQGRPRHHGQRLPGPPRRRVDAGRSTRPWA